jgi:alkylation response protein AidB-like acyl-CoA dehydrogenase
MVLADAPRTVNALGLTFLAPTVMAIGSDTQKKEIIGPMLRNEVIWCQGFSEPGAGSDLAALATRGVRDGDDFVVNGQKVWTTNGHHADLGYLLARTNPDVAKQAGITAFAVDMRTPGVDVRPLREITGTNDFNEVFLDDVRIPADQVIGEVDNGWRVANASLGHERSGVGARAVELYAQLDDLVELARRTTTAVGRPAIADGATRQRIGQLAALAHVTDVMSKSVQSRIANGTEDAADGPLAKVFYSEVNLAMTEFGVALQGVDGLAVEGDGRAYADGWWQDAFLYARAYTIAGGANEVLKTVVAERALGLPRDKR